jgi:hypothetical protein
MRFQTFEFSTDGEWSIQDVDGLDTGLFDVDTAAAGAEFSVTRTGADTYDVVMDPLGPGESFTTSRTFFSPEAPVDWIEFTFFNTFTDTSEPPAIATDFYIRSIEITGPASPGVAGDYNSDGTVNAADYVVWRDHSGQTFQLPNEVSGVTPGMVTPDDYTAWRARFGNVSGAGAASALGVSAVPEPSTLVSFAVGLAGLLATGLRAIRGSENE